MGKHYFFILVAALTFLTSQISEAQSDVNSFSVTQNNEDLNIYPNPVTAGETVVYISSKFNSSKKIEFFNVLGKRILSTVVNGNELNISNLSKGVYIVKITEKGVTHVRKLVIK